MLKMAIFNLLFQEANEQYKYHILLNHQKLKTVCHVALAYAHNLHPYTCFLCPSAEIWPVPSISFKRVQYDPVHFGDAKKKIFSDFTLRV